MNGTSIYRLGETYICAHECPTKFFRVENGTKICILPRDCVYHVEDTFECTRECGADYYLKDDSVCTKTRCEYVARDRSCTTAEMCPLVVQDENDILCVTECEEGEFEQPKSDGRIYCQSSCDAGYRKYNKECVERCGEGLVNFNGACQKKCIMGLHEVTGDREQICIPKGS